MTRAKIDKKIQKYKEKQAKEVYWSGRATKDLGLELLIAGIQSGALK